MAAMESAGVQKKEPVARHGKEPVANHAKGPKLKQKETSKLKQDKEPLLQRIKGLPSERKTLFIASIIFIVFGLANLVATWYSLFYTGMFTFYVMMMQTGLAGSILTWGGIKTVAELVGFVAYIVCIAAGVFGVVGALRGKAGVCKVLACICVLFAVALVVMTILSAVFDVPAAKPTPMAFVTTILGLVLTGIFAWTVFRVKKKA